MVTYIIRRLLYSVLVLVAASFLVFTFVAKGAGDPLGPLRVAQNVDQEGLDRIAEEKHLNDSVFVRYGYWVQAAVTNNFGDTLLTNKPILPDLWRVMKNTLQLIILAELLAILIAVGIGVLSALRQYSGLRLHGDDVQLPRPGDAVLLARAHGSGAHRAGPRLDGDKIFPVASLNDVDPGSGIDFWIDRAHHLALPMMVLMMASIADVLALHARLDARGRERRLRAHRAGQGAQSSAA